nr:MATE family efflux transporter [Hazenella coriacea]
MLSNALQSLGGTISAVIMGRGLGEEALAAASAVFPVTFFLISIVIGIGSASSILIGQAYGGQEMDRLKQTVHTSLKFSFLLGLIMAAIGFIYARELLGLMGTPKGIIDSSVQFAQILFAFLPIQFIYINYTTFLRGTGDSKTPFYFLIISTGLNIILTPFLALGWAGFPQWGLRGVAIAGVLSIVVTLVFLFVYLKRKNHILMIDRSFFTKLTWDGQILKLLLKIGLPTSVQMIFVSLSAVAVITLINGYGEKATAAYGAVMQVITYVQLPAMSLGMAVGIFGSQLIGARAVNRLKSLFTSSVLLNYTIGLVLVSIVYLFSSSILSWFLVEPTTLAMAKEILYIVLWSYMIFGHAIIISGLMRSSGTVFWPTLIGIIAIWGVQVPCAYLLSGLYGLNGVWMAYPMAFLFNVIVQYLYYRFFWRGKQHESLFVAPSSDQ